MKYAVTDTVSGVDLGTVGVILMIAGAALAIISLIYAAMWRDRRTAAAPVATRERVVERDPLV